MVRRSRRYDEVAQEVNRDELYSPQEALRLVKETATAGFDETVELAVNLGVDPAHADQIVRGAVVLPNGTGQEVKVLAFAKGQAAEEAKAAGADWVGTDEYAERIREENWLEFDVAVASPDVMNVVGPLGPILGPRGLMPNPKSGTVTTDMGEAIEEIKAGKVEYRTDRAGIIHVPIGKVSFTVEELEKNLRAMMTRLLQDRPSSAKGRYLRSITVSSTMGPGVKINPASFREL